MMTLLNLCLSVTPSLSLVRKGFLGMAMLTSGAIDVRTVLFKLEKEDLME